MPPPGSDRVNLRSMSPQGTHILIARRRNSITYVFVMNDMLE